MFAHRNISSMKDVCSTVLLVHRSISSTMQGGTRKQRSKIARMYAMENGCLIYIIEKQTVKRWKYSLVYSRLYLIPKQRFFLTKMMEFQNSFNKMSGILRAVDKNFQEFQNKISTKMSGIPLLLNKKNGIPCAHKLKSLEF